MGATTFGCIGWGKDARDAFLNAIKEAQYEYGHSGYTGTVAEKSSFVIIQKPKTRASTIDIGYAATALDDYIESEVFVQGKGWVQANAKQLAKARREKDAGNKAVLKRYNIPPRLLPEMEAISKKVADKWGPAGCIALTGTELKEAKEKSGRKGTHAKAFFFFGWASE